MSAQRAGRHAQEALMRRVRATEAASGSRLWEGRGEVGPA